MPDTPFTAAVQSASPWPTFRRDRRNTGWSPLPAVYHGDKPWAFATGKGIFATPVIDGNGVVYVGSADHNFYAMRPDGALAWRFVTGDIIDSAAALPRIDPAIGPTILIPSGDGFLYCLRTTADSEADRVVWRFDARTSPRASYNNWWEGNVAIGPDGAIYAGNTNFNYYALDRGGRLLWTYPTGANAWSLAAIDDDGALYWGSNDGKVRRVSREGQEQWLRRTWGFIAASAALGSDGVLYIGSFDSYLYALDARSGKVRWKFKTHDHIYSSAALGQDASGRTTTIFFGSTDGTLYALAPDGSLLWAFDAGAPIRSSPVIGQSPPGETSAIVYFGCGNGRLYALNTGDGSLRWAFDTTPNNPILADRNDLNGSPALGQRGIYIGGEHGHLCFIPYDYPLHVSDPRGQTSSSLGASLADDGARFYFVTPGGNLTLGESSPLPAASLLTLRLVVRRQGRTLPARLWNLPLLRSRRGLAITVTPPFAFDWQPSANGRYLHIFPHDFLTPGQTYTLTLRGRYYTGGLHFGNLTLGGRRAGDIEQTIRFQVAPSGGAFPMQVDVDEAGALEWTRLAVPIPTMLPSLNQIGFDYMNWIVGVVWATPPDELGRGKAVLWAIGGRHNEAGLLVSDPASDFTLPLSGSYQNDSFILSNRSFKLAVTGIPIPFNLFQLRGQMGRDLSVQPGATVFADAKVLAIPTFGPLLVLAGLASNGWERLLAMGTYVARAYDARGGANIRPPGFQVDGVDFQPPTRGRQGHLTAHFRVIPDPGQLQSPAYPPDRHRPGLLLLDAEHAEAVPLNYHSLLSQTSDASGNLASVTLALPAGAKLPARLKAIVLLDVFPLQTIDLVQGR